MPAFNNDVSGGSALAEAGVTLIVDESGNVDGTPKLVVNPTAEEIAEFPVGTMWIEDT